MIRSTLFFPILVAAVGAPFLLVSGDKSDQADDEAPETTMVTEMDDEEETGDQPQFYQPVRSLGEFFRFDLTPEWVLAKWKSVTQTQREGMSILRMTVVSGHQPQDIAGALTYEFDSKKQLKKIAFKGYTENSAQLIQFLTSQFGFRQQNQPGVFSAGSFSGYQGQLTVLPSTQFAKQFQLDLEIRR